MLWTESRIIVPYCAQSIHRCHLKFRAPFPSWFVGLTAHQSLTGATMSRSGKARFRSRARTSPETLPDLLAPHPVSAISPCRGAINNFYWSWRSAKAEENLECLPSGALIQTCPHPTTSPGSSPYTLCQVRNPPVTR